MDMEEEPLPANQESVDVVRSAPQYSSVQSDAHVLLNRQSFFSSSSLMLKSDQLVDLHL